MEPTLPALIILPLALGLLGFVEPCSMGANLLFLKTLEERPWRSKLAAASLFTLVRALVIGALGVVAVLVGQAFTAAQKGFWVVFGAIYLTLGVLYLAGKAGSLMRSIGPSLTRLSKTSGTAGLALLFGFNIPACAAPLLFALFGAAASAGTFTMGFTAMALFGVALSAPLVLAVAVPAFGGAMDRIMEMSRRLPFWTGLLFVGLGLWSLYFGLFVNLENWTWKAQV